MIDFRVLGPLELKGPDGEDLLSVLSQPKRVALLAYLALATDRGFRRRDTVIGVFWPDLDQERARAALRKSLYFLRRSLGDEALRGRGDEEISLAWEEVSCDAVDFETALEASDLEAALDLYRGDLLEGLFLSGSPEFERWLDAERERLRERAAAAAWELSHRFLSSGRVTEGERMGQRALALVPTDENEARRFIAALNHAGDRAAAIRFYEKFASELRVLLDLRPSAETRALVEDIRNTSETPIPLPEEGAPKAPPPPADTPTTPQKPSIRPAEPSTTPEVPTPPSSPVSPPAQSPLFQRVREALVDRYMVEREIGQGGMATVFLAKDLKHRRLVALKVLDPELAESLGADRFLKEIEIAANLTHPHILPLFDSGEANGLLYYVMPYVEGESLRSKLDREKQLPVSDAVTITQEVARALAFAHEKGVIHRDVKPANILLEAGHAVLADFGIAHAVALAGEGRQTRSGVSLGTPAYMSPEQSTGDTGLDGRSDQYGLGCVLYEMLAGDQPFRGPTGESVARQHLIRDPNNITDIRPSVPEGVAAALHRSMEKAPADRFSTMSEFSEALEAGATATGVRVRAQPTGAESKPSPLRSPRSWTIGALGLAAVVVVALVAWNLFKTQPGAGTAEIAGTIKVAVLPFGGLEDNPHFGESLARLLTITMDDKGGIAVVDRNRVLPHFASNRPGTRIGLEEGRTAAESFGATHFILGDGTRSRGQEVTVAATLYSVAEESGDPLVGSAQVEGSPEDLRYLSDRLALQLLGYLQVASGDLLGATAALTTDSLSALNAWDRGETEFRATRYEEAFDAFSRAVSIDPTFALAHWRRSVAAVLTLRFPEAHIAADRADEYRNRLSTKDQNLVRAWKALLSGDADRAKSLYLYVLQDHPDAAEAHFGLGEAQIYLNPTLGLHTDSAAFHFRKVLEYYPDFGEAVFHLLEIATRERDRDQFEGLLQDVPGDSDQSLAWRAVRAFWFGIPEEQSQIKNLVGGADPVPAGLAVARVAAFLQDFAAAEELATLLTTSDRDPDTRCAAYLLTAMTRLARGQWTAGMESLNQAARFNEAWANELKALYLELPGRAPSREELAAVRAGLSEWSADEASSTNFVLFAHNRYHPYLRLYLLALTSLRNGDPETARMYADELQAAPHGSTEQAIAAAWASSIRARVRAAAGDPEAAARELESATANVPLELVAISPFFSRSFERYRLGELYKASGDFEEALRWFRSLTEGHELVLVAPAYLQMAKIEEELGRGDHAFEHYTRFVRLWANADPELQPMVEAARAKIAELARKP